jgi:hypothetical protein
MCKFFMYLPGVSCWLLVKSSWLLHALDFHKYLHAFDCIYCRSEKEYTVLERPEFCCRIFGVLATPLPLPTQETIALFPHLSLSRSTSVYVRLHSLVAEGTGDGTKPYDGKKALYSSFYVFHSISTWLGLAT